MKPKVKLIKEEYDYWKVEENQSSYCLSRKIPLKTRMEPLEPLKIPEIPFNPKIPSRQNALLLNTRLDRVSLTRAKKEILPRNGPGIRGIVPRRFSAA